MQKLHKSTTVIYFLDVSTTAADQDLPLRCPLGCFYAYLLLGPKHTYK